MPRGATTTVAALLDRAAEGQAVTATVQGVITHLAGTGHGVWATIDDGTAGLDLFCPSSLTAYGPVTRRRFEIDVVSAGQPSGDRGIGAAADGMRAAAGSGNVAALHEAAAGLSAAMSASPSLPRATAVRPLD